MGHSRQHRVIDADFEDNCRNGSGFSLWSWFQVVLDLLETVARVWITFPACLIMHPDGFTFLDVFVMKIHVSLFGLSDGYWIGYLLMKWLLEIAEPGFGLESTVGGLYFKQKVGGDFRFLLVTIFFFGI